MFSRENDALVANEGDCFHGLDVEKCEYDDGDDVREDDINDTCS
jgi:hypothetical protein